MTFRKLQTILLVVSLVFMGAAAFSLGLFGLDVGIELTGGSLLEARYQGQRPPVQEVKDSLSELDLGSLVIQHAGERDVLLRMKDISEQTHQRVLSQLGEVEELRFESVGPAIGQELRGKTLLMSLLALGAVVLYIAFAFRRTMGRLRPWHWSGAALVATFHDVLLPLGVFAALGEYAGMQVTIPVLVALLTVIGYSVNDTVVVFDRIRENIVRHAGFDLADTIRKSLKQTWVRSLSTSFTTLLVLSAIYLFGGATLQPFSLMLIIGVVAGTWSSLFVAPALLTIRKERRAGV